MYWLVSSILQPFPLVFVVAALSVASLWRTRREGRVRLLLLTVSLACLAIMSLRPVSYLARGSLEWQYPPLREAPTDAGAIVVLGGGITPPDAVLHRAELNGDTVARCLQARKVYRDGVRLPIVVSGGKVDASEPGPTLAEAMREFLAELGIPPEDLIVEGRSRTTYENGVETARLLQQRGIRRIILVTDASHMLRAVAVFRKQGIDATAAGCRFGATHYRFSPLDILPSPSAAQGCQDSFHEWLGIAWYRLSGKM